MEYKQIKGYILVVYQEVETYINVNHIIKIKPVIYQYEPNATDKCQITLTNEINPIILEYPLDSIIDMIEEATY